jgi:hypothetical protein
MDRSTFIRLASDSTRSNYLGLNMWEGKSFRFSRDYLSVEIPLGKVMNPTEDKEVDKASRNQHLLIMAACSVAPREGYKVLVKTNPVLQGYGSVPPLFLMEADELSIPMFHVTFRKDFDVSTLEWVVRLYLLQ